MEGGSQVCVISFSELGRMSQHSRTHAVQSRVSVLLISFSKHVVTLILQKCSFLSIMMSKNTIDTFVQESVNDFWTIRNRPFSQSFCLYRWAAEQRILAHKSEQPTAGCIAIFLLYKHGGIATNLNLWNPWGMLLICQNAIRAHLVAFFCFPTGSLGAPAFVKLSYCILFVGCTLFWWYNVGLNNFSLS